MRDQLLRFEVLGVRSERIDANKDAGQRVKKVNLISMLGIRAKQVRLTSDLAFRPTNIAIGAYSSAGQSARLISVRSVVQVHLGPPTRSSWFDIRGSNQANICGLNDFREILGSNSEHRISNIAVGV